MAQDKPMPRKELAERLHWLAHEWRNASPELQKKIEQAFRKGTNRGTSE